MCLASSHKVQREAHSKGARLHLHVCFKPVGALQKTHALLNREVRQCPVQLAVCEQVGEGRLALRAPHRLLLDSPGENALTCHQTHTWSENLTRILHAGLQDACSCTEGGRFTKLY